MARTVTVTLQDGKQHVYQNVPDDITPEAVTQRAQTEFGQGVAHLDGGRQAAPAPAQAAQPQPQRAPQQDEGVISGVGNMLRGAYHFPERVMQSAVELGARGTDAVGLTNGAYAPIHKMYSEDNASAAGGSKYYEAGKVIGDVAGTLPLTGLKVAQGAPLLAKLPRLAKVADAALQGSTAAGLTSSESDAPLGAQLALGGAAGGALPVLGAAASGVGKLIPNLLGGATGTGTAAVRGAYQAGKAGGEAAEAFKGSMRGDVPWENVVAEAKDALATMRAQRGKAYRSGMLDVSKDKTVLDFAPVDEALASTGGVKNFKGQDLSKSTATVRKDIEDTVANWKTLDPGEYHTPEGFDALKQQLKDIMDNQDPSKPSFVVAKSAYDAVRNTIAKQAPAYDKVMRDYAAASEEVSNIQRELSLGSKGNPGTALRKLQSVMRNNANTSWGARASMADRLTDAGATTLLPSLAGQSMNAALPRGLARVVDTGLVGIGAFANPGSLAALPLASPRAVGELAYGAGAINRGATNLGKKVPITFPALPTLSPSLGMLGPRLAYQQ